MLSAVTEPEELIVKEATTLDLYKTLPSDDECDEDFKVAEVEETEEEKDEEDDDEKEEDQVPLDEIEDIVRVKNQVFGAQDLTSRQVSNPQEFRDRFVDQEFDESDQEDEEYKEDLTCSSEGEDLTDDSEVDDDLDQDIAMDEEEVQDNIKNVAAIAGEAEAKDLLLKRKLRNNRQLVEPYEELLKSRIASLLNNPEP